MLAYAPLDVSPIYVVVKFNVLTPRQAALAMSQSGRTGRPSKHPKLVRHTLLDPNQPSNHVDRHRIFSLQRSGQVGLRTSYIPTSSPEKEDKDIPARTLPTGADPTAHTDNNPWNETEYFDPACEVDDAFGAPEVPTAEKRRRRTAGVSLQCYEEAVSNLRTYRTIPCPFGYQNVKHT